MGIRVGSHVIFLVFAILQGLRIRRIIVSSIRGIIVGGISVGGRVIFIVFMVLGAIMRLKFCKEIDLG